MFRRLLTTVAAAALALSSGTIAAHAAGPVYVNVNEFSSPVGWGAAGDHADLILSYSASAPVPLLLYGIETDDIGGANINSALYGCGQLLFGGPSGSRQLMPGESCLLRAYRSRSEIASRLVMWDSTGTTANINSFVRASLEVRDGSDNVLTHVDLR